MGSSGGFAVLCSSTFIIFVFEVSDQEVSVLVSFAMAKRVSELQALSRAVCSLLQVPDYLMFLNLLRRPSWH